MTPQQAIDNIAVYSALHNGVLDSSVKVLEKSVKALDIIKKKCLTNCNIALVKDNATYDGYCKEFEYFLNKYNESPNGFEITKEDLFTQNEYNLLKEVFGYEECRSSKSN